MKNAMHHHPSEDVQAAIVRLADALTSWNRTTSRDNLVIIKDTVGVEYRAFSGAPIPEDITDEEALKAFETLKAEQPAVLE